MVLEVWDGCPVGWVALAVGHVDSVVAGSPPMIAKELNGSHVGERILLCRRALDGFTEKSHGVVTAVRHEQPGFVMIDLDMLGGSAAIKVPSDVEVIPKPTN